MPAIDVDLDLGLVVSESVTTDMHAFSVLMPSDSPEQTVIKLLLQSLLLLLLPI